MARSTSLLRQVPVQVEAPLPGLPRAALTPEQHLEAIRRVQNQAEQRVKLGVQLFKAAEAHTSSYRKMLDDMKAEQTALREQMGQEIAGTLQRLDQRITQLDASVNDSLEVLEQKIERLEQQWTDATARLESMMKRSEALLDQSRYMLEAADARLTETLALREDPAEAREVDCQLPIANCQSAIANSPLPLGGGREGGSEAGTQLPEPSISTDAAAAHEQTGEKLSYAPLTERPAAMSGPQAAVQDVQMSPKASATAAEDVSAAPGEPAPAAPGEDPRDRLFYSQVIEKLRGRTHTMPDESAA